MDIDYYWDGKLAPKVHITGKLVDRLSGYSLIKKDLDNALKWMRLAKALANEHRPAGEGGYLETKNRDAFDLVKVYFVASVTFYAKCFTETAGRHAQASRDWLDPGFLAAHDSCMSYRNNLAAHSGDKQFELAKTYVLIDPDEDDFIPYLPTIRMQHDIALNGDDESGFVELFEHVVGKVAERYDRLEQKLINDSIVPLGARYWRTVAKAKESVALLPPRKKTP